MTYPQIVEQAFTQDPMSIQAQLLSKYANTSDRSPKDLKDFWLLFKRLVNAVLAHENASQNITITEGWPEYKADRPWQEIINYDVDLRRPGSASATDPYNHNPQVRTMRPRVIRAGMPDADNPGYTVDYYEQPIDNWIFINCWSRTNREADYRALWIENLLSDFRWYFQAVGVTEVLWLGQGPNREYSPYQGGDVYYGRPLEVFLKTQKTWSVRQKTLEEIQVLITPTVLEDTV